MGSEMCIRDRPVGDHACREKLNVKLRKCTLPQVLVHIQYVIIESQENNVAEGRGVNKCAVGEVIF